MEARIKAGLIFRVTFRGCQKREGDQGGGHQKYRLLSKVLTPEISAGIHQLFLSLPTHKNL